MTNLQKVLLKVVRDNKLQWVHFAYVASDLYEEFFRITKCEKADFGTYVSIWAQGDFGLRLSMTSYEDIQTLRQRVKEQYQREYSELYALSKAENPYINGWLRLWLSQHMRVAIAARKED